MPLLDKETFTLKQLNPNLGPEDEVFYCAITGEAFEDYKFVDISAFVLTKLLPHFFCV